MFRRFLAPVVLLMTIAPSVFAQGVPKLLRPSGRAARPSEQSANWRASTSRKPEAGKSDSELITPTSNPQSPNPQPPNPQTPNPQTQVSPVRPERELLKTPVSKGDGRLPNDHGQIWREYDIRSYSLSIDSKERPEQAIVDWILRETGTDMWFGQPLAILSASRDNVRVYHTPEVHSRVREIIDRFIGMGPTPQSVDLRLMTVNSPNWRIKALPLMEEIDVRSPGLEGWLVSKENAVVLLSELRKRTDAREVNAVQLAIHPGQMHSVSRRRPRRYVKTLRKGRGALAGPQPVMGEIEEGFTLDISPLFDPQNESVDVVIKASIDQVERLLPVSFELPGFVPNQTQSFEIQVPQLVSWRLHERFAFPTSKVLVLSCGVVAAPAPERKLPLGLKIPFTAADGGRADALLFVETKGSAKRALTPSDRSARARPNYHGRY